MPAKLGSADVSFRLGATTPAKVALGAVEVWAASRTLYFINAVDGDWAELGNWFNDADGTSAATALPGPEDTVYATNRDMLLNSGAQPAIKDMFWSVDGTFSIVITVSGTATFLDYCLFTGTLTGNAVFGGGSGNAGTINGNATFNDSSYNSGVVTGSVICNTTGICTPT